jgi:hypothetical protein
MRKQLERIEIPGEHEARERAWRVVERAFAEREPQPHRRSWKPIAAVALAVAVVAGLLSPPGRAVLGEIREVVGVEKAEPALFSLPTSGQLLITSNTGTWIVDPDGSKRFLGDFRQAAWSPFGRFVVGARQNELVALEPDGDVRWTLARPDTRLPRWGGTRTDTRIAYLSGYELRVVGGDGKGDRLLDRQASSAPPVWRPGPGHRLAYARRDGSVRVVDVDTGTVLDRDAPDALLVARADDAALLRKVLGDRVVLGEPVRSPDGRWLAVHWPAADQLLFVRTSGRPQLRAVSNISSQFGTRRSLTIDGWCCEP